MSDRFDCWHSCCEERHNPHHDHFLSPDQCPACLRINGYEYVDGEWRRSDTAAI